MMITEIPDFVQEVLNLFEKYEVKPKDNIRRFVRTHADELHYCWDYGASRVAIMFKGWNYVLKISRLDECLNDYNQKEARNYLVAKETYRVERVLLPIELLYTTAQGVEIYIQPKYDFPACEIPTSTRKKWERKLHDLHKRPIIRAIDMGMYESRGLSALWVARALQLYGKVFMRKLEEWSHAQQINDLHSTNVGWLNGRPVIIDYAGYDEW